MNGCHMPKLFNIKTLVVKFVSCACAVGAGLPVGPEGPMIHIGALVCAQDRQLIVGMLCSVLSMHSVQCSYHVNFGFLQVGSALSQGHSTTLNFTTGMFTRFQNPRDQRDFVTAGASCSHSSVTLRMHVAGMACRLQHRFIATRRRRDWRGCGFQCAHWRPAICLRGGGLVLQHEPGMAHILWWAPCMSARCHYTYAASALTIFTMGSSCGQLSQLCACRLHGFSTHVEYAQISAALSIRRYGSL